MTTLTPETQELDPEVIEAHNLHLEGLNAADRIAWAAEQFGGGLVASTSFGVQSAVMLHLIQRAAPGTPVIFVDTGYLFPETYRFARELTERLGIDLKRYQGLMSPAEQEALYGKLWEQGKEGLAEYNLVRKVEPMNRALGELNARGWMTGLRRSQASTRRDLPVLKQQKRMLKIHPIVDWSDRDVYQYLQEHELPYHPLWHEGYVSVGDWHSSQPLSEGMTAEQTRFGGVKRECGLHELSDRIDFQI